MNGITELSLYSLDNELLQLMQYREERVSDQEDPAAEEELQALDGEIRKYMEALPRKVDKVAGVFRMWKGQKELIKAEADRLAKLAARIEANEARLKSYVADVLELQPMPAKGCKKLTGADGSVLMLKGNGGLAPLKIQDDILPDEYRDVTVRLPLLLWRNICQHMPGELLSPLIDLPAGNETQAPANGRIREALKLFHVPGAHLEERGQHVEIK